MSSLAVLRAYLDAGRPLVALRTASHAFSVKGEPPAFQTFLLGAVHWAMKRPAPGLVKE